MSLDRRTFIAATGLAASVTAACADDSASDYGDLRARDAWDRVRRQFAIERGLIDMSAMLLASHPRPVREGIERHRRALDRDTVGYLEANNQRLTEAARAAAGSYLSVAPRQIALVDSTTMGVGIVYAGLRLAPGDEILTTEQDYFVTHESARLACARTGAVQRRVSLHGETPEGVSAAELAGRIAAAITPRTRVVGLTWVHSSTGLKIPVKAIADVIEAANGGRDEAERILFVLDGVHGYGNQDVTLDALGCDFIASGCHKWLFGPRGTGMIAGRDAAWRRIDTQIPSFLDDGVFDAWITGREPGAGASGARASPGGFKAFEHRWALPEAFALHDALGKDRVEARTHELASQLKEGLRGIDGVTLATPLAPELSAGIVSFDIDGASPDAIVSRLRDRRIVASAAPYARPWVRLTPSIRNTPAEIDAALSAVRELSP
ncbi:MAG TPA: aminotransferase class V-fold PLP-dependent enzyme [Vitreimonas sp.]|uniref:aminotransferase class V-fold PLP-dependent enzyme n=1 Tax=Vitreimonas sp. TaxID=3069702 RepID=UPI002D27AF39|nr:aminotransferase class V-fold PLP-dependent enzyme [Vitreimonas sp.]HYD86316.1 aminotransferase class V-fold PLP-dependent enzyme [Vitreimonas sp.]